MLARSAVLVRLFTPSSVAGLFISDFFLSATCFIIAMYIILPVDPMMFLLHYQGGQRLASVVVSLVIVFYFLDLYDDLVVRSRMLLLQQLVISFGLVFLSQAFLSYLSRDMMMPRWVMTVKRACLSEMCWMGMYSSPLRWFKNTAWRWKKVPRPVSCPDRRTG